MDRSVLGHLMAFQFVGRRTDTFGSTRVLQVSAVLMAMVPLPYLWIETSLAVWLANFYSGLARASVNISAFKYLVGASRGTLARSGFVYAKLWLTSTVLGMSLLGGLPAPRRPTLFQWPLQTRFGLSALLRVIVVLGLFTRLVLWNRRSSLVTGARGSFSRCSAGRGPGTAPQ